MHEWFLSYFAERTQTMHIDNGHISSKKNSVTGVPQGSVLTPPCKRSSSIYILIGFSEKASTGRQSFYHFAPSVWSLFCLFQTHTNDICSVATEKPQTGRVKSKIWPGITEKTEFSLGDGKKSTGSGLAGSITCRGVCFRPLLFLICINNFYLCCNKLGFYLFADDTKLLYADKDLKPSPGNRS